MIRKTSIKLSTYLVVSMMLVVLCPLRAVGWGTKGHEIISRIAMARLSPGARQAIAELLEARETLETVSGWADLRTQPAGTRSWHFVSIPLKDARYSRAQACGRNETCLIEAIDRQLSTLKDTSKDKLARAEALKFLIHLIADLHQPFHVTTNTDPQDSGANRVKVISLSGRSTSLHEVWDTDLVEYGLKQNARSVSDYATKLNKRLAQNTQTSRSPSVSTQGSVIDWALESHKLPWRAYYSSNGEFMVADGKRSWTLDQAYYDKNVPLVEGQLVRAGARLAQVLNDAFNVKLKY